MKFNNIFFDIEVKDEKKTIESIIDMGARLNSSVICLVDSHHGIYMGKMLAESCCIDLDTEDEFYMESIDSLLNLINEIWSENKIPYIVDFGGYNEDINAIKTNCNEYVSLFGIPVMHVEDPTCGLKAYVTIDYYQNNHNKLNLITSDVSEDQWINGELYDWR